MCAVLLDALALTSRRRARRLLRGLMLQHLRRAARRRLVALLLSLVVTCNESAKIFALIAEIYLVLACPRPVFEAILGGKVGPATGTWVSWLSWKDQT